MHKQFKTSLVALALTIGVSTVASSTIAAPVYTGQVCAENTGRLVNEISWNRNLDKVKEEAAEQGKLVLWVHMVGKIDGFT